VRIAIVTHVLGLEETMARKVLPSSEQPPLMKSSEYSSPACRMKLRTQSLSPNGLSANSLLPSARSTPYTTITPSYTQQPTNHTPPLHLLYCNLLQRRYCFQHQEVENGGQKCCKHAIMPRKAHHIIILLFNFLFVTQADKAYAKLNY